MGKDYNSSPFLFPSTVRSYPSESTPSSPSSESFYSSSSLNSPYKSSSSTPRPPVSQSSSVHVLPAPIGPCASCKIIRKGCTDKCFLASYIPSNQPHKFVVADTLIGSANILNFLQQSSNSSYIPLLLVLRDTAQDGEIQSHPNKDDLPESNMHNLLATPMDSDHLSTNAIVRSRNDYLIEVEGGIKTSNSIDSAIKTSSFLGKHPNSLHPDGQKNFLSHDGDGRDLYGMRNQSSVEHQKDSTNAFSFSAVGCIRTRNRKVICCNFSSGGKLLASAGHDKKVVLWDMDTMQSNQTSEEHKQPITDVCFRPNSSQLATASLDKYVRLWDAANPSHSLRAYAVDKHVMSLDFHPTKTSLLCFGDDSNQIHYLNVGTFSLAGLFKGGAMQVRFQPRIGHLLAAASDKVVSIFDVEFGRQIHSFQGHSDLLSYICWDANGDYLASVGQNSVKIWSLASGDCIHEFVSNQIKLFYSCVFHPTYSNILVIGGYSLLELWNFGENKAMRIPAHESIISALAQSPGTGVLASASHDASVKLWK